MVNKCSSKIQYKPNLGMYICKQQKFTPTRVARWYLFFAQLKSQFWRSLDCKMFIYLYAYHLVIFYSFITSFGKLHQETSGNPDSIKGLTWKACNCLNISFVVGQNEHVFYLFFDAAFLPNLTESFSTLIMKMRKK
jgi:hypothetical protein